MTNEERIADLETQLQAVQKLVLIQQESIKNFAESLARCNETLEVMTTAIEAIHRRVGQPGQRRPEVN